MLIKDAYNFISISGGVNLVWKVIKLSILIQVIGAGLLAILFIPSYGLMRGAWYSVFHAVSAYNNAGFDLFDKSLIAFQANPYLLVIIAFLILAGGFGFIVWFDLIAFKHQRLTRHTRLAITMTATLTVTGTVLFMFLNLKNYDGHLFNFLAQNFFLSVTPRTAGFYTVDYNKVSYASLLLTMIFMFIGGTSGSTAGGIKTTTFGVLILNIKHIFQNKSKTIYQERQIPRSVIRRVYEIVFLYFVIILISSFILLITEKLPLYNGIEYVVFEVISALGTVGLTMGLTPDLTVFGKILLMFLMFIGRIGIMTVIYATISRKKVDEDLIQYPEEEIVVG
jgi:trk system potassium uptake protein TrkH